MNQQTFNCANCGKKFARDDRNPEIVDALVCDGCRSDVVNVNNREVDIAEETSDVEFDPNSLLPPKFLAIDPDFVDYRVSNNDANAKLLLPDGKGGVSSVESNVVRIQHRGEFVELKALPPKQRRRRQLIINVVAITVGVLFILLFFLLAF